MSCMYAIGTAAGITASAAIALSTRAGCRMALTNQRRWLKVLVSNNLSGTICKGIAYLANFTPLPFWKGVSFGASATASLIDFVAGMEMAERNVEESTTSQKIKRIISPYGLLIVADFIIPGDYFLLKGIVPNFGGVISVKGLYTPHQKAT